MQPVEVAIRLRVKVALDDAQAHCGAVVSLASVGILTDVLVSGPSLRGSHADVSVPVHDVIVVGRVQCSVHLGVELLCAKCQPKSPGVFEVHAVWKS